MRHCAKSCRLDKPLPRYCDFSTFKMAAVRHLGFSKVCNFVTDRVERVKVRHHAKLSGDWSIRC